MTTTVRMITESCLLFSTCCSMLGAKCPQDLALLILTTRGRNGYLHFTHKGHEEERKATKALPCPQVCLVLRVLVRWVVQVVRWRQLLGVSLVRCVPAGPSASSPLCLCLLSCNMDRRIGPAP